MAELKTQENNAPVADYLATIAEPRRSDAQQVMDLMAKATSAPAKMWGSSIIGFGRYSYSNTAGKEFTWMLTGVAPRKSALSVYIMCGFQPFPDLMDRLGKYKTGKSCLYITRLGNVDLEVLDDLIVASVKVMQDRYGT